MLKGAIIGFGKIAVTAHMPAYSNSRLNNKIRISAVVEPDEQTRTEVRSYFPEINFYKSTDEMFAREQIDFVDISCPPVYHYEVLKECIKRDVHIICEKPFTLTLSQAEEIYNLLMNSSKVFIPCHQYKYSPVWKNFKGFVDQDANGSKVLLQFNVFRIEADPGLKQLSNPWRTNNANSGGGILADTGVHYLYLSSWLLGKIEKVTAQLPILHHNYNAEDTALITLESSKGIIQIALTWAANKRFNDARAVCANGSIFYENGGTVIKHSGKTIENISVPDASDKSNYILLYVDMLLDFLSAVESNKPQKEWIEEAYNSIHLMSCCYKSSDTGKTIWLQNEK